MQATKQSSTYPSHFPSSGTRPKTEESPRFLRQISLDSNISLSRSVFENIVPLSWKKGSVLRYADILSKPFNQPYFASLSFQRIVQITEDNVFSLEGNCVRNQKIAGINDPKLHPQVARIGALFSPYKNLYIRAMIGLNSITKVHVIINPERWKNFFFYSILKPEFSKDLLSTTLGGFYNRGDHLQANARLVIGPDSIFRGQVTYKPDPIAIVGAYLDANVLRADVNRVSFMFGLEQPTWQLLFQNRNTYSSTGTQHQFVLSNWLRLHNSIEFAGKTKLVFKDDERKGPKQYPITLNAGLRLQITDDASVFLRMKSNGTFGIATTYKLKDNIELKMKGIFGASRNMTRRPNTSITCSIDL